MHATQEYGKILSFLRDIHNGYIPTSIEIPSHQIEAWYITTSSSLELQEELLAAPPGPLLPATTPQSDTLKKN